MLELTFIPGEAQYLALSFQSKFALFPGLTSESQTASVGVGTKTIESGCFMQP